MGWEHLEQPQRIFYNTALSLHDESSRIIFTPPIRDAKALFVFLHECGHVRLGHFEERLPRHVEEYQAEKFAIFAMGLEGIPVAKEWVADAKYLVRRFVAEDIRRGIPICGRVARWCGAKLSDVKKLKAPQSVVGGYPGAIIGGSKGCA